MPDVSVRQNSPADAGVDIERKANASNAEAGAAANFKTCFIFVSLVKTEVVFDPRDRGGMMGTAAPLVAKNSKEILSIRPQRREKRPCGSRS
jgi:hypothetical protein